MDVFKRLIRRMIRKSRSEQRFRGTSYGKGRKDWQEEVLYSRCIQVLGDRKVTKEEVEQLLRWFDITPWNSSNLWFRRINTTLHAALADGVFDSDEENEIFTLLSEFCDAAETGSADKSERIQTAPVRLMGEKARRRKKAKASRKGKKEPCHKDSASLSESIRVTQCKADLSDSALPFGCSIKFGEHLELTYKDSSGRTSRREIVFRKYESKGGREYIQAICLLRSQLRTFRADRITSLVSSDTGEVFM